MQQISDRDRGSGKPDLTTRRMKDVLGWFWQPGLIGTMLSCKMCRRIALSAFAAILLVEVVILIFSVQSFREQRLLEVEHSGRAVIDATVKAVPGADAETLASLLVKSPLIAGIELRSGDGTLLLAKAGEPLSALSLEKPFPQLNTMESRARFLWKDGEAGTGREIRAMLVTGDLRRDTNGFILRILGLSLLISAFVTLVLMPVLGFSVLIPILRLRRQMIAASADPSRPEKYALCEEREDELGEVMRVFDRMLMQMGQGMDEVSRQKASLEDARQLLEKRVAERTEELKVANLELRREIAQRQNAEQEVDRLSWLQEENEDALIRLSANGRIVFASENARALTEAWNIDVGQTLPDQFSDLLEHVRTTGVAASLEVPCGEGLYSVRLYPAAEGNFMFYARNLTGQAEAEKRLLHLASHDVLTGLANRTLLLDRLDQVLKRNPTAESPAALLMIDLSGFKDINEAHGVATGDMVLQDVAEVLRTFIGPRDTVARFGGDEFAFILAQPGDCHGAVCLGDRILAEITRERAIGEQTMSLRATVGIAMYPGDGHNGEELIRNASLAAGRAKQENARHPRLFVQSMDEEVRERRQMAAALRKAISDDQLELHYQPKLDVATGTIKGAEALIRWRDPEEGMISPARFIPVAERSGLILEIGEIALRKAIWQARAWQQAGLDLKVAVNLSPLQFQGQDLPGIVEDLLVRSSLSPALLELEITETVLMDNAENTARLLSELHGLGVGLSIDDFGTGYSSLSYLRAFPVHRVKIDRAFIKDIQGVEAGRISRGGPDSLHTGKDRKSTGEKHGRNDPGVIARSVISLGHNLGLEVTAEGVETEEQLAYLRHYQCDEIQGFLISKPVSAAEITNRTLREMVSPLSEKPAREIRKMESGSLMRHAV